MATRKAGFVELHWMRRALRQRHVGLEHSDEREILRQRILRSSRAKVLASDILPVQSKPRED